MAGIVFPIAYKVDDAALKSAEGAFKGFAGRLGGILAGIGIANIVGDALKIGFGEAMDAASGLAQLEAGIKSTGGAAGVSSGHLMTLAGSIQAMSGQTDDSIVKTEQLLLTFTNIKNSGPDKIFDQATRAAADMAAKMGGDASTQAIRLGKALNDPIAGLSALTRVGVSFTDAQKEQVKALQQSGDVMGAQKIILAELNKEFGGAAEAAGKSLPGQIEIMKRSFEDMTQSLVEMFLPMIKQVVAGLTEFVQWMGKNKEAVTAVVVAVLAGVAAFGAYKLVMEASKAASAAWIAIQTIQKLVTGEATIAQLAMNSAFLANPIGLVVAGVTALVAGLIYFFTQTKLGQGIWAGFVKFMTDSFNAFLKYFNAAVTAMGTFFKPVFDFIGNLMKNYINGWIGLFQGFVNGIIAGLNGVISMANAALALLSKATGGTVNLSVPTIPPLNLPRLAEGGVVMPSPGGSLVNIAEAGEAEAVVPLSKLDDIGGKGKDRSINITVNAGIGADGAEIGRKIVTEIKKYERTNGAVWVSA